MTARNQVKRRIAEWEQFVFVIGPDDEYSTLSQSIGSVDQVWDIALGRYEQRRQVEKGGKHLAPTRLQIQYSP